MTGFHVGCSADRLSGPRPTTPTVRVPANPDTFTHRFGAICDAMEAPALKRLRRRSPGATADDLSPKDAGRTASATCGSSP